MTTVKDQDQDKDQDYTKKAQFLYTPEKMFRNDYSLFEDFVLEQLPGCPKDCILEAWLSETENEMDWEKCDCAF